MVKERVQKKSYQQSLDDIKEKMKEKRNKRLASASAPRRGRPRINKSAVANSTNNILKGIQQNNKALAVTLQAEKEKVRQAHAVILQLKREQQALFLHLLLLKRKLKDQEASSSETKHPNISAEPQQKGDSARRKRTCQNTDESVVCKVSPVSADPQTSNKSEWSECDTRIALPSTVGVRRRHVDRRSKRRSERVRERRSMSDSDIISGSGALIASPIHSEDGNSNQPQQAAEPEFADPVETEEFQHSTPEPDPQKKTNQQRPGRRQAKQQQPPAKPEPAPRKQERGRKPERAPLKKPWENPKPRARSKSRDRSASRAKTAPTSQGNHKLNTSLGFNDTFDFDCEETIHVTPFKAKAEDNQPATPISEESSHEGGQTQTKASPAAFKQSDSSSSSPSSESEDSLYVPQKKKSRWRLTSPDRTKVIATRRGRRSIVIKQQVPPKQKIMVFRDEETSPKAEGPKKKEAAHGPSSHMSYSNSPDSVRLEQENQPEPHTEVIVEDCLPPVSPLVEAEMMRIDNVLSHFGDSPCEAPPHQTPQMVRTGKRANHKFSRGGSRPSDARCSTPVVPRKRRCTMAVDYKEPSLTAKLRRGDKHTDLQFLQSPIFKQKSGRSSMHKSRKSVSSKKSFGKYNESFVGCR
ncbi:shugoshin 1-like isoform X2 [Xyrichtys novacula]|uniref:Shugoshin 1-like isoform X2 n=1 Tax=Xyrichtys novacula TaxID=13765 RepID=A0AAV1HH51_XYRNO|nr:shugoshin 1-like isoform X2 [Xyrichtys novacula]